MKLILLVIISYNGVTAIPTTRISEDDIKSISIILPILIVVILAVMWVLKFREDRQQALHKAIYGETVTDHSIQTCLESVTSSRSTSLDSMSGVADLYSNGIISARRTTDANVSISISRQSISRGRTSTDTIARPLPVLIRSSQNRNEPLSVSHLLELIQQDVFEAEPPPPYNI